MTQLNPQIQTISVGTKELREVTIYPLSMADQFGMTDIIVEAFTRFSAMTGDEVKDTELIASAMSLIEENLSTILKLVVGADEDVTFSELTNDQFSSIVTLVFEVNYESSIKKLQALVEKVKVMLPGAKAKKLQ